MPRNAQWTQLPTFGGAGELHSHRPMIIGFTGIDGAGKTWHARTLMNLLRERGLDCKYVWLRFSNVLLLPVLGTARLMGWTITWTHEGREFSQPRVKGRIAVGAFMFLHTSDYLLAFLFRVQLPKVFGKTVIVDRCIVDALADMEVATGVPGIERTFFGGALLRLLRACDHVFALEIDRPVLLERRPEHRGDPSVDQRLSVYRRLFDSIGMTVIDTRGALDEASSMVLGTIGPLLTGETRGGSQ